MGNTTKRLSLDFIEERTLILDGSMYFLDKTKGNILNLVLNIKDADIIEILPNYIRVLINEIIVFHGFKGSQIDIHGDIYDNNNNILFRRVNCNILFNTHSAFESAKYLYKDPEYFIDPIRENHHYFKPQTNTTF